MEINTQKIRITFFFALLAVAFSFCQNNASTITTQKSVVKDSIQTKPTAVQVEDTTHDFNHGKAYIVEQIIITSPTFLKITRGLAERVIKNG